MAILQEINELMWKVLKKNYLKIIRNAFILFLAFPIIKWGFWSLIYIIKKSDWVLNKLVETTFLENVIPWYLNIFIDFKGSLRLILLLFLLIWLIYSLKESVEDGKKI